MITVADCFEAVTLEESALTLLNKITFNYKKGYAASHDQQTYWDFGSRLRHKLKIIKQQLRKGEFNFGPMLHLSRRLKANKVREIYISTWADKIVERWLNDALNNLLNDWFAPNSYAYRTGELGLDRCQHKVARILNGQLYVAKRDISSYFYSIDHQLLLAKLDQLIDPNDYLSRLIKQRVKFVYKDRGSNEEHTAEIGIPFGSALACTLSNIFLTDIDKIIIKHPVTYFRYADDFLIISKCAGAVIDASRALDDGLKALKLIVKPEKSQNLSFKDHPGFTKVTRFKYLGLVFTAEGKTTLSVEKQRKILNFYKRTLQSIGPKLGKLKDIDSKVKLAVDALNDLLSKRIRSVAIIDYYLKHVTDEHRLRQMDRLIAEMTISTILTKPFRPRDFQKISFQRLRQAGLVSLLHRHRLHKHGHLNISFMELYNEITNDRYMGMIERRQNRINQIKLSRKLSKISKTGEANEHQSTQDRPANH